MARDSPDTDGSTSEVEVRVHEEVAGQPDATIVELWESEGGGVFVVVERPGPENRPLQTLYRVTLEPTIDGGDHLNWALIGPYTPD
jgi:hypothetical protein